MTWKRKTFVVGQAVMARRSSSWQPDKEGWEPATYLGPAPEGMDGWHRVEYPPTAPPRYVCSRTGLELPEPNSDTRETRVQLVPARRIREAR